ncbi:hypothetical protein RISK_001353 [Rhodopirellula islandica]|uniref:Uncharacterized protein n=1 Tax=Rhodopirellula islandica TaxID=595434 RepID=A0A0J1BJJ9_RHOIS|nr:hypothetical protein RISK_001353 [Rhodopirellula islandica]
MAVDARQPQGRYDGLNHRRCLDGESPTIATLVHAFATKQWNSSGMTADDLPQDSLASQATA